MALDPSIALAYRPPQVNVDVPSPLQQLGQVLTLRNMMQQGQLGQLGLQSKMLELQQQQLAYKQAMGMADLLAHPENYATQTPAPAAAITPAPAAPAAPGTFVVGQGQSGDAIHSPDGGASWVNSATGAPYSGPRYGETPVGFGTEGAPYSPASTYSPVTPAVPRESVPSVREVTPQTPAFPGGGIPGMPSWRKMIEVGGASAFPWIKNITEAYNSQLETQKKQLDIEKGKSEDMVRLANGMTTNEFKDKQLWEAGKKGYISWDDVRKYQGMDVNDPRFQAQKESWGQQALTYDKSIELGIKRNEEARNQHKEVRDWVTFNDTQNKEQERQLKEKVMAISDPSQFASLLTTPHLQNLYGSLVGKGLNEIRLGTQAGKVGETVAKPTTVTDAENQAAAARISAETGARIAAEDLPYAKTAADFNAGKVRWDQLSPKEQEAVGRINNPPGSQRTTKLSDAESTRLTNMQTGLDQVRGLQNEMTGPWSLIKTGKFSDIFQDLPVVGAKWDALQGRFGMLQATVGDLIKGGVLRAADAKVYQQMFPNMGDSPWTVREKLKNLETKLTDDLGRYKESLRAQSRYIPGEAPPAAPGGTGADPAPGPSYQTIEKSGAPGPKVTGTFNIGGAAAAAPPGKIIVVAPASRGGGQFYLDSDKWPQYQKQGFTRAD